MMPLTAPWAMYLWDVYGTRNFRSGHHRDSAHSGPLVTHGDESCSAHVSSVTVTLPRMNEHGGELVGVEPGLWEHLVQRELFYETVLGYWSGFDESVKRIVERRPQQMTSAWLRMSAVFAVRLHPDAVAVLLDATDRMVRELSAHAQVLNDYENLMVALEAERRAYELALVMQANMPHEARHEIFGLPYRWETFLDDAAARLAFEMHPAVTGEMARMWRQVQQDLRLRQPPIRKLSDERFEELMGAVQGRLDRLDRPMIDPDHEASLAEQPSEAAKLREYEVRIIAARGALGDRDADGVPW